MTGPEVDFLFPDYFQKLYIKNVNKISNELLSCWKKSGSL